jgi:EAL domain-containing protein (putative c-di-GMP-specific phosphodiesterase class I)
VAEGIEHVQQGECLRAMGCRYGQGYLYARPMPAGKLPGLLRGTLEIVA